MLRNGESRAPASSHWVVILRKVDDRRPISGHFYHILGGHAPKNEADFRAKRWVVMLRNFHKERVCRINACCTSFGRQNVIVVSIHANAAGNGSKWMKAQGWSCYTSKGNTRSDELAECLCNEALKNFSGRKLRTDMSDGDKDFEEDFYILKYSRSIAVLTESFFYDNEDDLQYLESSKGKSAIVRTHVEGLRAYLQQVSKESLNNR